ncbi:hypothetical protein [Acinetobacter corruptisaponis]|uniref:hypothetical protein n=1 Tax=Acinetobacter corruptisaponis TaxID=3045147 RepID=UPI0032D58820
MKIMTRFTPVSILFMAAIFAIMWSGAVIWVSFNQPYMGLKLGIVGEQIRILDTDSSLAGTMESPKSQVLKRISIPNQAIDLIPMDLAPEPDSAMGTYRNYAQFLERQGQIADMLRQQKLELTLGNGQVYSISVTPHRPVKTFDLAFWVQLIVGVVAWLISAAVSHSDQMNWQHVIYYYQGYAPWYFPVLLEFIAPERLPYPQHYFNF